MLWILNKLDELIRNLNRWTLDYLGDFLGDLWGDDDDENDR